MHESKQHDYQQQAIKNNTIKINLKNIALNMQKITL